MWTNVYAAAAVVAAAAAANDVSFNCEKYLNSIINFLLSLLMPLCRNDEIGFVVWDDMTAGIIWNWKLCFTHISVLAANWLNWDWNSFEINYYTKYTIRWLIVNQNGKLIGSSECEFEQQF